MEHIQQLVSYALTDSHILVLGGNWMYFEIGCRDFAVEKSLDLVVYTGIKDGVICILKMLFRDTWCVSARGC